MKTLITESTTLGSVVKRFPSLVPIIENYSIPAQGCHSPYTLPLKTLFEKFSKGALKDFIQELNTKIEDFSNKQFSVSTEAIDRIKTLALKNKKIPGLRILVKEGGCAGKEYKFEFENNQKENDVVIEEDKVKIFIDKESIRFLNGSRLEFVNSLMGGGFRISNPQAKATCGCGKSFS
jgi:iron-sulfur cluster assembly accessory protein